MTNKEMYETFLKHDLSEVQALYDKGYTETSDFREKLEKLASSVEALLQDMDLEESEMDEIQFGNEEFGVCLEGQNYVVRADGGVFYGYADVKDGKCTKWITDGLKVDNVQYFIKNKNGDVVKFEPNDWIDIEYERITSLLHTNFTVYLEDKYIARYVPDYKKEIA